MLINNECNDQRKINLIKRIYWLAGRKLEFSCKNTNNKKTRKVFFSGLIRSILPIGWGDWLILVFVKKNWGSLWKSHEITGIWDRIRSHLWVFVVGSMRWMRWGFWKLIKNKRRCFKLMTYQFWRHGIFPSKRASRHQSDLTSDPSLSKFPVVRIVD